MILFVRGEDFTANFQNPNSTFASTDVVHYPISIGFLCGGEALTS